MQRTHNVHIMDWITWPSCHIGHIINITPHLTINIFPPSPHPLLLKLTHIPHCSLLTHTHIAMDINMDTFCLPNSLQDEVQDMHRPHTACCPCLKAVPSHPVNIIFGHVPTHISVPVPWHHSCLALIKSFHFQICNEDKLMVSTLSKSGPVME